MIVMKKTIGKRVIKTLKPTMLTQTQSRDVLEKAKLFYDKLPKNVTADKNVTQTFRQYSMLPQQQQALINYVDKNLKVPKINPAIKKPK